MNIIISVLSGFRDNLLLRIHWQRSFKLPLLYLFIFLRVLLIKSIFVLSAKWCTEVCFVTLYKSLMYRRNSNGSKTEPCGTPCVCFSYSELHSLILVYWYIFVRKLSNHLFVWPLTS